MKKIRISVDFDGAIVTREYPEMGILMDGAKETINKWHEEGHVILINTCRAEQYLDACRQFLQDNEIHFDFLNENDPELIDFYKMDTRKISADVYFDDKSMGGFCGWKKADQYIQWMVNRKPLVICLVGESGSGKTTLAEYIYRNFSIPQIKFYTTRPRRKPDDNDHIFISDEEFNTFDTEYMIAYTKFGEHRYCCLESDVKQENTYVIDEAGLDMLIDKYSDKYDIKTIRVHCGRQERVDRVGQERVSRDDGRFDRYLKFFDYLYNTDHWRTIDYDDLHKTINKWANRGWN